MNKLLWIAVLLVQGSALAQRPQPIRLKDAVADFPRSQLQLKTNGPVSIEVNQGDRAAYEQLAKIAGLNIVIDPDFRDSANGPIQIQNADVLQAFDILSARNGSFVEVLNSNTVIVSPDNPTKHRDYEAMVLKTFYLPAGASPQRLTETVTTLRTTLQARYLAINTTTNAVVIRDTPARIAAAEKIIGLAMPLVSGSSVATAGETITGSHILTLDGSAVRDSTPARSMLSPTATGPISFNSKDSTRAIFERLAQAAGLNVIFDPDFRSLDGQSFKVDNLNILDAMDVLALQTRTFWTPIDSKTILVAGNNQSKRRDFENVAVKTFYLRNAAQIELTEIVTTLRTILNARYLALIPDSGAIVMRDNATRLALAEKIIADLRKSGSVVAAAGFPSGSEAGFVLNRRAAETLGVPAQSVRSKVRGPLSFDSNDMARATYEAVAATAGLRIVFDSRFKDDAVQFKVENVSIADALDFLALQTRTIWQMLDGDTILVAPDSPTVRADLLPKITKAINLPGSAQTPANINAIITALRTILNLRQVSVLDDSIVMTDTAENIAFSEKIVKDLETPPAH
jgi:type II secretory pathway component GspD/PulD (secretin)